MSNVSTAVQISTIAALFITLTTVSFASESCEPDCEVNEVSRNETFEQRFRKQLDNQNERVGALFQREWLDEQELLRVTARQSALREKLREALQDGRIDADERRELQEGMKGFREEVTAASATHADLARRGDNAEARIKAGAAQGELTDSEKAALQAKLDAYRAALKSKAEGGLTAQERDELLKMYRELSKQIHDERRDAEGKAHQDTDRDSDNIDERQRNQAGRISACFAKGKISMDQVQRFMEQQKKISEKEREYLKGDRKLDRQERDDLKQLLDQAGQDIGQRCDERDHRPGHVPGRNNREPGRAATAI